jgi:uncharacterized protein (TIGR02118 family)
MVKLVFALRRLPHLTRAEFQRYWRERHAPLVEKHRDALGIRRYVQLHTRELPQNEALRLSRGAPEAFDGVALLWFDSAELRATPAAAAAAAELLEDERRFIDHARSPLFLADEHAVIDSTAPAQEDPWRSTASRT